MNAESFAEYLKNPSKLYQINYQELKSLALQYPYCQNLQLLLLQKSGMDHHRDFDTNLAKAATYSQDRSMLYHLAKEYRQAEKAVDSVALEEVFELPDLSLLKIERTPLPQQIAAVLEQPSLNEVTKSFARTTNESFEPNERVEALMQVELPPAAPSDPAKTFPEIKQEIPLEIVHTMPIDTTTEPPTVENTDIQAPFIPLATEPQPLPKAAFKSWQEAHTPQPRLYIAPVSENVKPKIKKEQEAAKIAQQSVTESQGIASETLAAILAKQGQIEKAIKMYERLILIFPEKSTYFAAQIAKLKR